MLAQRVQQNAQCRPQDGIFSKKIGSGYSISLVSGLGCIIRLWLFFIILCWLCLFAVRCCHFVTCFRHAFTIFRCCPLHCSLLFLALRCRPLLFFVVCCRPMPSAFVQTSSVSPHMRQRPATWVPHLIPVQEGGPQRAFMMDGCGCFHQLDFRCMGHKVVNITLPSSASILHARSTCSSQSSSPPSQSPSPSSPPPQLSSLSLSLSPSSSSSLSLSLSLS